jgi:guanine deaminase
MNGIKHSEKTIYVGTFVHSESPTKLDICKTGAIGVDESGKIAFVLRDVEDPSTISSKEPGWEDAKIVKIGKLEFFFPGFIGMRPAQLCMRRY